VRGSRVETVPGELAEMGRAPDPHSQLEKRRWYLGFKWIAMSRGNKPGVAFYRYQEKFSEKPPFKWNELEPIQPTLEVLNFDKYMRIRYAKRRTL
jgi:hypothetical protein